MLKSLFAICCGASIGAIARWILGNHLNGILPRLPLGTLVANLTGGYLIGIALAVFSRHPHIPSEWRLFVITGALGGLTTFSTFSAEIVSLIQDGFYAQALWAVFLHVAGSLLMTALGLLSVSWLTH